jgi:MYXO-CTERM domain-containing protein
VVTKDSGTGGASSSTGDTGGTPSSGGAMNTGGKAGSGGSSAQDDGARKKNDGGCTVSHQGSDDPVLLVALGIGSLFLRRRQRG